MVYQTDTPLGNVINHFGCYFCSILYFIEKFVGIQMTDDSVLQIYNSCVANGIIGNECFINDSDKLMNFVAPGFAVSKGKQDPTYQLQQNEFEVLCMYNPKTDFTHFIAGDGNGNVEFDPIQGGSRTAREGYVKSLRIFSISKWEA